MRKNRWYFLVLRLFFGLLHLSYIQLNAQKFDLRGNQAFFDQQLPVYQEWMEETGLSPALKASHVVVDSQKVRLVLVLDFADRDTAASAWNQLRQDFQKTSALALEERLFFKMAFVMELTLEQTELRILNLPAYGQLPAIDGTIFYDTLKEKVGIKGVFRTEVKAEVFIPSFVLDTSYTKNFAITNASNLNEESRYRLNNKIAIRLKNYFGKRTDMQNVFPRSRNPVVVEVMNIKSEVIPAGILGFTNPNEHLLITIDHKSTPEGIRFFCTIDGKYGNGLIKPRSVMGFRDMSPEYKCELARYINVFTNDWLHDWVVQIIKK